MNNFTITKIREELKDYKFTDKQGKLINLIQEAKDRTRFNNVGAIPFYRLIEDLKKDYYHFNSACVFKMVENLEKITGDIKIERVGF